MAVKYYRFPDIEAPLPAVLGRLGYNPTKTIMDNIWRDQIVTAIKDAAPLFNPEGLVMELTLDPMDGSAITLSGHTFYSRKLTELWKNCRLVSLLCCTVGPAVTSEVSRLTGIGELNRAVIYDAVASETVEALADRIQSLLEREKTRLGLRPVMRYSPGYGDVPTSVHKWLLPLLESDRIGLSAQEGSYILKPEKSITAFIGWESNG